MAQLKRLKWIPMIIQAYNEARNRVDWRTLSSVPTVKTQSPNLAQDVPSLPARQSSSSRARKPVKRYVRENQHQPTIRKAANAPFRSVIRELRETKHKLDQLESIQQKLNHLQSTLEKQLTDLSQRVDQRMVASTKTHVDPSLHDPHYGGRD